MRDLNPTLKTLALAALALAFSVAVHAAGEPQVKPGTKLDCAQCHAEAVESFNSSHHAQSWDKKPPESCLVCHVNSHQNGGHHNCMQAIYSDGLHRMEVLDRLPVCLGKGHVATHISSSATRLQPAHNIALRKVLVFQAHRRMGKDASFFQHPVSYGLFRICQKKAPVIFK